MPTIALHQKYRPKTLAELVGQPYVKTALTTAIDRMQIAPAYSQVPEELVKPLLHVSVPSLSTV